jgi:CRP/FNR family transcriptional regulator
MPDQMSVSARPFNGTMQSILNSDPAFRAELARISTDVVWKPDQVVVPEHAESETVGFVLSGVLRVVKNFLNGRTQVVSLVFPGEFFGRLYGVSEFSTETATMTRLRSVNRAAFEKLLSEHPGTKQQFLEKALNDLDLARNWSLMLSGQRVIERLSTFLMLLSRSVARDRAGHNGGGTTRQVRLPVSRRDTALLLGTTCESISRALSYLAASRVLRPLSANHFEILDDELLIELSGRDPDYDFIARPPQAVSRLGVAQRPNGYAARPM